MEVLFGSLSHDVWMAICDGSGSVLNRALVARLSPLAFDIRRQYLGSLAWDGDEVAVLTAQSGLSFRLSRHGEEPSGEGAPPGIAIRGAETSADVSSRICAVTSYVSEMAARAVRAELDLLGCPLVVVCGRGARPPVVAEEGLLRVGVAFDAEELLWLSPQKRGAVSTGILRIAAIELADDRPALSESLQAACEDIEGGRISEQAGAPVLGIPRREKGGADMRLHDWGMRDRDRGQRRERRGLGGEPRFLPGSRHARPPEGVLRRLRVGGPGVSLFGGADGVRLHGEPGLRALARRQLHGRYGLQLVSRPTLIAPGGALGLSIRSFARLARRLAFRAASGRSQEGCLSVAQVARRV